MGREGEGVVREKQDETRQGRAQLKRGGKPFLSAARIHIPASLNPLFHGNEFRCLPHTSVQASIRSDGQTGTMYESRR